MPPALSNHLRLDDIASLPLAEIAALPPNIWRFYKKMCLIDLKLTRLAHDPSHQDSILDIAGYAAVLHEVSQ